MSVIAKVREAIRTRREGAVLSAQSLASLGSREAIDQALGRLSRTGEIIRISRGIYVRPIKGKFGSYPPSAHKVVNSLAKAKGEAIVANGAVAANNFGLSTQQPVRSVYLTSGKAKKLALGSNPVELRHVAKWQTLYPHRKAGEAIRALAYLGKTGASEAAIHIKRQLPTEEWRVLVGAKHRLPNWVAEAVGRAEQVD